MLANALVYFPFWLLGENAERSTIYASVLFHSLSIPVTFLFLERLSGKHSLAAVSAALLAVAPVYTVSNTFGKEYGLAVLLLVGSFHLALTARDTGSAVGAATSAVVFSLSYIVWEGLLAVTPLYLVVLFAPRGPAERPLLPPHGRRLAAAAAVGYCVGLAFDLSTSLYSTVRTYAESPNMTGFLGLASPVLRTAGDDLVRFLGWPFLAMSTFGIALAWRHPGYRSILLLGALLSSTLVFYGNLSTYGPRYLVLCALGLSMFAGAAFDFSLARAGLLRVAALAALVLVVGSMIAVSHPLLAPRRVYNGPKRFALFIAEKTEPESVIIVMDDSRFVQYYAHRATLGHPINDRTATNRWVTHVRREMETRPVYLAESGLSYDPEQIVSQAIAANFSLTLVGTHLTEDYHHAERQLQFYLGRLWRLQPK